MRLARATAIEDEIMIVPPAEPELLVRLGDPCTDARRGPKIEWRPDHRCHSASRYQRRIDGRERRRIQFDDVIENVAAPLAAKIPTRMLRLIDGLCLFPCRLA